MKQKKFHLPEEKKTHQEQEFIPQDIPKVEDITERITQAVKKKSNDLCPCGKPWSKCWRQKPPDE